MSRSYRASRFLPYLTASVCLALLLAAGMNPARGSDADSLASFVALLIGGLLLAVVAFVLGEPALSRAALRHSLKESSGRGGAILEPSVRVSAELTNEFAPVEGTLAARFERTDASLRAASLLIAVTVADVVQLRTGLGGGRLLAAVPTNRCKVKADGDTALLVIELDRSSDLVIPILSSGPLFLRRATIEEAKESLRLS